MKYFPGFKLRLKKPEKGEGSPDTIKVVRLLSADETKEVLRRDSDPSSPWKYLREHAKELVWSCNSLSFGVFAEKKKIDWLKSTLVSDNEWECYLLDKNFKDEHFQQLDPSKFRENIFLKKWYQNETNITDYEFSDSGKAMLDGVCIIHKYLELVDDESVVLLQIG